MSTRRIDDLGSFDGDAVGALVAQLPGATRLSHVLTAGAKHLAAQQQLQQRKSADVAGYARSNVPAMDPNDTNQYNYQPHPLHAEGNRLSDLVAMYLRKYAIAEQAGKKHPMYDGYVGNVIEALDRIRKSVYNVADLDYLREHDAYVALAYFYKQSPATFLGQQAMKLLREALHHDQVNVAGEQKKVLAMIKDAKKQLGGSDVAHVVLSGPGKDNWGALTGPELLALDRLIRGRVLPATAQEVENEKRAREAEEAEQRKADAKWVSAKIAKQEKRRAVQDERNTYSTEHNPDGDDPESMEAQERLGR